jgi:tetratricopeptide (TPR) repeat protein
MVMSMRRLTVFLSSTGKDLEEYRNAIINHMRPLDGFYCDASENFGARDASVVAFCRDRVLASDVLVGLIGHYRGWEPLGDNKKRSITELEYTWALEADKSRLMYVAPEEFAPGIDLSTTAEEAGRQAAFRTRVLGEGIHDIRFFKGKYRDPGNLTAAVMTALANVQYRRLLETIKAHEASTSAGPDKALAEPPRTDWETPAGEPAKPDVTDTLSDFAVDPDFAKLTADPTTFDVAKLEETVKEHALRRIAESEADAARAQQKLRAAAADFKRLAELTGFFDIEKARGYYGDAIEADLADGIALYWFARLSIDTGRSAEAERMLADLPTAERESHGSFWARIGLGDFYVVTGRLEIAAKSYNEAAEIAELLAKADPDNAEWQRDLSVSHGRVGEVLVAQGKLPDALTSYQASLDIRKRLTKADPANAGWQRNLSVSHEKVGDVQVAQGKLPDALTSFQASFAIRERLAKADPDNAEWQRDLSVSHNKVGEVLVAQGKLPDALTSYQASLDIRERLAKADPANAGWQYDLGISHERIGDVLMAQGDLPAALKSHQAKQDIISRLAKADPANAEWQRDLSVSYNKVGEVLVAQGKLPDALTNVQASFAIRERLAKADPVNAEWQRDLSVSHAKLASAYRAAGDTFTASEHLRSGRTIIAKLVAQYPAWAEWKQDLAWFDGQIAALEN